VTIAATVRAPDDERGDAPAAAAAESATLSPACPAVAPAILPAVVAASAAAADLERRFGALRRLYGDDGYRRVRAARIAVVGLGGVGSWAAEALARSGVAGLVLIDLDHVAESNVNRQVQALGSTLGMAKAAALAARIADIHPGCEVDAVEEFADAGNWPALLARPVDVVIDACDQMRAKQALAAWSLAGGAPLVVVGAAGGKERPQAVEADDLARATHDPLLAALRQRLRKSGAMARSGPCGLACVYSREPVRLPLSGEGAACAVEGGLNCHGYGSSVTVTATFGMVAASEALRLVRVQCGMRTGGTALL
jgi:tRNA A37 threonylcarbamoyladenosine dehydratase